MNKSTNISEFLVAVPEFELVSAVVSVLSDTSANTDVDDLDLGSPTVGTSISTAILDRALARVGHNAVWKTGAEYEFPCCIALNSGGYAVALGVVDEQIILREPGPRKTNRLVRLADFEALCTKNWFQVLPAEDYLLEQYSGRSAEGHWFWSKLLSDKRRFAEIVVASLFANMLAVATSLFALQVYDRVIPAQAEATLWVLASGVGIGILFEALLRLSRAQLIDRMGRNADLDITSDLFSRVLGMRLDKRPGSAGSVAYSVREFSAVKEFFTTAAVSAAADLPFVFIFLALTYAIAGQVAYVIGVGALIIMLPNLLLGARMSRLSEEALGGLSSASRLLTEVSYGLETVKTTSSESYFKKQWEEIVALNAWKTTEQRRLGAFLTYWATAIQQATYVLSVTAGVYLVFAGEMTTGAIISVGILSTRTLSPITQISQILSRWQNMKSSLASLDRVANAPQDREPDRQYIRKPVVSGELKFKNVKFFHPEATKPTLDLGSLIIPQGSRLVLLGPNGSGKSTFLRLTSGLFQPEQGELLLDGLDYRQIDPTDMRRNIGYLPQDVQLFRGSIRDNLQSYRSDVDDAQMIEALNFSGLGDFINSHPKGLDLQIHDGGSGLSVGQRQSIGLARLFLQNPKIVLLDEPTAALDQRSEALLVNRIGNWIGDKTCIVATHRLQILSIMSHIAVLQEGRIAIKGPRDEVLKRISVEPSQKQSQNETVG